MLKSLARLSLLVQVAVIVVNEAQRVAERRSKAQRNAAKGSKAQREAVEAAAVSRDLGLDSFDRASSRNRVTDTSS